MSLEPIAIGEIEPEATLEDCEQALAAVERNAAIQQGIILRHIRDTGLYRTKHATFDSYVEQALGYQRTWAYQRIDLADTVQRMSAIADIPQIAKESQARAIKPVLRDHGPEVAAEVLREAADDDGKLTARSISEAATRVIDPDIVDAEVIEIPGDEYRDALERYPELNVEGAEAGDVVEIAAMIDARPDHEHRARADAGAKWLAAKAGGRLDTGPIVNETEAAERIYKSAYLLLKEADRYGDQLPDALLHADPLSRAIWERTLLRLAERAAELAEAIPTQTLRSIQ